MALPPEGEARTMPAVRFRPSQGRIRLPKSPRLDHRYCFTETVKPRGRDPLPTQPGPRAGGDR